MCTDGIDLQNRFNGDPLIAPKEAERPRRQLQDGEGDLWVGLGAGDPIWIVYFLSYYSSKKKKKKVSARFSY